MQADPSVRDAQIVRDSTCGSRLARDVEALLGTQISSACPAPPSTGTSTLPTIGLFSPLEVSVVDHHDSKGRALAVRGARHVLPEGPEDERGAVVAHETHDGEGHVEDDVAGL